MPAVTGREISAAFGIVGTNSWGVATSVTYGVYFQSDGGIRPQPTYVDDPSFGQQFTGPADVGDFGTVDAQLPGQLYYDHHTYRLQALAMGSPAAVSVVSSQAANSLVAYQHIIDLAPNVNGRAITFAMDKVAFVEEVRSAKVVGFSWSVGDGGVMQEQYHLLGDYAHEASAINTRSAVTTSATFPALLNRVFRNQGALRMNAQSAGSLVAADALPTPVNLTLTFDRPQDTANVFGKNYAIEPADSGQLSVGLTLEFARVNSAEINSAYRAAIVGGTAGALKADIAFTGGYINSTSQRSLLIQFPYLEVREAAMPVSGGDNVRPTLNLVAKKPSAAPTGMAGVTQPFRITRVSVNSTAAF